MFRNGPAAEALATFTAFDLNHLVRVMPKTLPAIYWRGAKLPQQLITRIGVATAVILNLLIIILLSGIPS